eukprot:m.135444 g.135444  ORF g.135444 m.135444 type:complete len:71 (+) comp10014_c0_seq1:138-350(+)
MSTMYTMERLLEDPKVSVTNVMYTLEPIMDLGSASQSSSDEEPTRRHELLYRKQMQILMELNYLVDTLSA